MRLADRIRFRAALPPTLTLVLGLALAAPAPAREARLERASGEVELGRDASSGAATDWRWEAAAVGASLAPGDAVRTGRDGRAELRWRGATIRLYGDSLLRLPAAPARGRAVELDDGSGLFDVERREGETFEVHTPEVVVSVKGTRFSVSADGGAAEVAVYRGVVGVRARALALEGEVLVREGFRAVGGAERPAELFLLDAPDPWPGFGPRAQPPRDRSGRTAASPAKRALDDAREAGRQLGRAQALRLALERDPGLPERLEAARDRHRARQRAADERVETASEAAAPARARDVSLERVDAISDARVRELDRILRSEFVQEVLTRRMEEGSAGGDGSMRDRLDVRTDGELVYIEDLEEGRTWTFDQLALVGLLSETETLPSDLAGLLEESGVDDTSQLAGMLLGLLM